MRTIKIILGVVLATAVTVGLAYFLGSKVGGHVATQQAEANFLEQRDTDTRTIVSQAKNLTPGNTLPDHVFETMSGEQVGLYDLLGVKTPIAFFSNGCPACTKLAQQIASIAGDPRDMECFVFITDIDLEQLTVFREQHGFNGTILIDRKMDFMREIFKEVLIPTIIVVDSSAVIENVFVGGLTDEEIADFMSANRGY